MITKNIIKKTIYLILILVLVMSFLPKEVSADPCPAFDLGDSGDDRYTGGACIYGTGILPECASPGTTLNEYCTGSTLREYYANGLACSYTDYDCSPYICVDTTRDYCKSSCSSDSDCVSGYHCDGSTCYANLANGATCDEDSDCTSGDCNTQPDDTWACTDSTDECADVSGNGRDTGYSICVGSSDFTCSQESIATTTDGWTSVACTADCKSDGDGTYSAKTATCSGSACVSYSSCTTGYACSGTASKTDGSTCTSAGSCTSDNQCADGYYCQSSTGDCVDGNVDSACDNDADCDTANWCYTGSAVSQRTNTCISDSKCANSGYAYPAQASVGDKVCQVGTEVWICQGPSGTSAEGWSLDTACSSLTQCYSGSCTGSEPNAYCGYATAGTDPNGYCAPGAWSCYTGNCGRERTGTGNCAGGSNTCDTTVQYEAAPSGQACSGGSFSSTYYCSTSDFCSGDTRYTGKTCDGSSYTSTACTSGKGDIGCCYNSKCSSGYYCTGASSYTCSDLPTCAEANTPTTSSTGYNPQENGEDLWNDCSTGTYSACTGSGSPYKCQRLGADGDCAGGSYACDNNDATFNIASGSVCTGSGTSTVGTSTFYAFSDTSDRCSGTGISDGFGDRVYDVFACNGANAQGPDVGDKTIDCGTGCCYDAGSTTSCITSGSETTNFYDFSSGDTASVDYCTSATVVDCNSNTGCESGYSCTYNNCVDDDGKFYVKDSSSNDLAIIDSSGKILLKGSLYQSTATSPPANSFRIRTSGSDYAWIDSSGNLYLKGTASQNQGSITPSGGNDWIIKNNAATSVLYVDGATGNLYTLSTVVAGVIS